MMNESNTMPPQVYFENFGDTNESWTSLEQQRVRHKDSGYGIVIRVTDDSISIKFDHPPVPNKWELSFSRSRTEMSRVFTEITLLHPVLKALARRHTDFPKKTGEKNLAKKLAGLPDPKLHLWFGIDFVPGVRDNDVLVWHEDVGIFVVEVKAVDISAIEYFGWEKYKINGRKEDDPPHRQADRAKFSLGNFLAPQMPGRKMPFMASTACWPLISRDEWNRWWDDDRVTGSYAQSLLFREDVEGGVQALVDRLEYIWEFPPVKEGAIYPYRHSPEQLAKVISALSVTARPRPAPSDLEKLRIIESQVAQETLEDARPGGDKHIYYHGYPGTGKTFRLLQIGVSHALAGHRVLFSCFNKVLASDIRRILSNSEKLPLSTSSFDVFDVSAIAKDYANGFSPQQTGNYDKWGEGILKEMRTVGDILPKYETVLIDEAQDMKDWQLEMLQLLSTANATICVAGGLGQNLYGSNSEWLTTFVKSAKDKRLNRNFRNTAPVGILSHVFYEVAPNLLKIPKSIRKFTHKPDTAASQLLLFQRPEGKLPGLVPVLVDDSSTFDVQADVMGVTLAYHHKIVSEYGRIVKEQIDQFSSEDRLLDLLVLVPKQKSLERVAAIDAIKSLGLAYIDYTDEDERRYMAQPNMIRICTFHSSRGIEGRKVVIFGIEQLEDLAREVEATYKNLGFVTLSRALFECVICTNPKYTSAVYDFIEAAISHIRKIN